MNRIILLWIGVAMTLLVFFQIARTDANSALSRVESHLYQEYRLTQHLSAEEALYKARADAITYDRKRQSIVTNEQLSSWTLELIDNAQIDKHSARKRAVLCFRILLVLSALGGILILACLLRLFTERHRHSRTKRSNWKNLAYMGCTYVIFLSALNIVFFAKQDARRFEQEYGSAVAADNLAFEVYGRFVELSAVFRKLETVVDTDTRHTLLGEVARSVEALRRELQDLASNELSRTFKYDVKGFADVTAELCQTVWKYARAEQVRSLLADDREEQANPGFEAMAAELGAYLQATGHAVESFHSFLLQLFEPQAIEDYERALASAEGGAKRAGYDRFGLILYQALSMTESAPE